jgi:hypothetical protein
MPFRNIVATGRLSAFQEDEFDVRALYLYHTNDGTMPLNKELERPIRCHHDVTCKTRQDRPDIVQPRCQAPREGATCMTGHHLKVALRKLLCRSHRCPMVVWPRGNRFTNYFR